MLVREGGIVLNEKVLYPSRIASLLPTLPSQEEPTHCVAISVENLLKVSKAVGFL